MISIQITTDAIQYFSDITGMELEDAEEELQTVISLCKFEAAQQNVQSDGAGTPWTCDCGYRNNGFHKICGGCGNPPRR